MALSNTLIGVWRISRPMNLGVIVLLFYIMRYYISRLFVGDSFYLSDLAFFALCFSTVCIAAGGYAINDYFDRNIDAVNKPKKLVVGNQLTTLETVQVHLVFSLAGVLFGGAVGIVYEIYSVIFIQLFAVGALFYYALKLKSKGLAGNIIVALLTGLTPLIAGMYEFLDPYMEIPLVITCSFAVFAFLFTLVRELIKDLEDMDGDNKFNCTTFPIKYGVKKTKRLISVLLLIIIGGIGYSQNFSYQLGDWITPLYFSALVQLPSIFLIYKINSAKTVANYHFASQFTKVIMLFGILSGAVIYYIN